MLKLHTFLMHTPHLIIVLYLTLSITPCIDLHSKNSMQLYLAYVDFSSPKIIFSGTDCNVFRLATV